MPISLSCPGSTVATIDDVMAAAHDVRDHDDPLALAAVAPTLAALSNDGHVIVQVLNRCLAGQHGQPIGMSQSMTLARMEDFALRADIWPSTADLTAGRMHLDGPGYVYAHDFVVDFLTTVHFGPGYVAESYEYDASRVEGWLGEPVQLRFTERSAVRRGVVMLYRGAHDVVLQGPPQKMSITLTLARTSARLAARDQLYFDLQRRRICGFGPATDAARLADVIELAGYAGNAQTCELLESIARTSANPRARLAATESRSRLQPDESERIWEQVADDVDYRVAHVARQRLLSSESGR